VAKVELTGLDDLLKELNALSERIAARAENKALREGAEILRAAISKRAPRRTGRLLKSIEKSNVKRSKEGVKYIEVGPNRSAFYGVFLEFGTSKMAARPFIGPALEEKQKEIFDAMGNVLREELAKKR